MKLLYIVSNNNGVRYKTNYSALQHITIFKNRIFILQFMNILCIVGSDYT